MQAGYIASSYDIGGILTVLPVTFLCGRLNKSLVIGLSFILLGIGTIIYSLPHFLAEARLFIFSHGLNPAITIRSDERS